MLDLSNNNGHVNFRKARRAGHKRVYLKATEGMGFVDLTYGARLKAALAAGFKVGAYHFAHTSNDPVAEARRFHAVVGKLNHRHHLRPCLDFELGSPSAVWAERFLKEAHRLFGVRPIIYSYADFLHHARFRKPPASLWLAAYGRNDGREYPFYTPLPWGRAVAHQFTSNALVPGVEGRCDVSVVFKPRAVDVPRFRR